MTSQAQTSQKGIPSMPDYLENLFWSEGMSQRIIDVVTDSVEVEEQSNTDVALRVGVN